MATREEVRALIITMAGSPAERQKWGYHSMDPDMSSVADTQAEAIRRLNGDVGLTALEGYDRTGLPVMAASLAIAAEQPSPLTQQ